MPLRAEHDPDVDAAYIYLAERPYAFGEDLDYRRRVDYASDGTPIGVELLYVSDGVDLRNLPRPDEIAEALRQLNIRVPA